MHNPFDNLTQEELIKLLEDKKIKTLIDGDMFEVSGQIDSVELLENDDEYFILVNFNKGSIFNENVLIFYDQYLEPLGKLAYSLNLKDKKVSFDYFFVRKDLRGQHLGQEMVDIFLDEMEEIFGPDFEVYTNPYSFDTSFNGSKDCDYETQLHQYRLERFYLRNSFLLTEDPKKYVFGGSEYEFDSYNLTEKPVHYE